MKKILLTIAIIAMIAIMGVTLVACNNATTQGQLANLLNDHNHERFEYTVYAESTTGEKIDGYDGTYTVTLDAYDKGSIITNFGNATLSDVQEGVLVRGKLVSGNTVYETGCYFNLIGGSSYMVPAYTFRTQSVNGEETFRLQGTYSGATLTYERYIDGVKDEGSVSAKATTYFDNNEFHQSLRTITTFSTGLNFSFSVPVVSRTEATYATLSSMVMGTMMIKNDFTANNALYQEKGIECYEVVVSRSTEVSGLSQALYYAVDDVADDGWDLKNVLVRIVEPFKVDGTIYNMIYDLTLAELE